MNVLISNNFFNQTVDYLVEDFQGLTASNYGLPLAIAGVLLPTFGYLAGKVMNYLDNTPHKPKYIPATPLLMYERGFINEEYYKELCSQEKNRKESVPDTIEAPQVAKVLEAPKALRGQLLKAPEKNSEALEALEASVLRTAEAAEAIRNQAKSIAG